MNRQEARPKKTANQERVLIMEKLEKVELVREKCKVSYEEAREALEACNYDVLDAIVMLEQEHKVTERIPEPVAAELVEATYETAQDSAPNETFEAAAAEPKTSKAASAWKRFCASCKELLSSGMETAFIAERNGERMFEVPLLLVVIGMLMWGASLWLLVAGLFCGFRYHIEGTGKAVSSVNSAMGKVADAAEDIKQSVA